MSASPKVRAFCRRLFEKLDAENWGDIEPDVFRNIAEGHSSRWFNKMSEEDMEDAVESMTEILEEVLQ